MSCWMMSCVFGFNVPGIIRDPDEPEFHHDALLKNLEPFIEPEAVPICAFEQYRQWKAFQEKGEGGPENND